MAARRSSAVLRRCCVCGLRITARSRQFSSSGRHVLLLDRLSKLQGVESRLWKPSTGLAVAKTQQTFLSTQHNQEVSDDGLLKSIGVKDKLMNENTITRLESLVQQARSQMGGEVDRNTGTLLYTMATRFTGSPARTSLVLGYICRKEIVSKQQLTAAIDYFRTHPVDPVDVADFEQHCGVGVITTREQITQVVVEVVEQYREELVEKGYQVSLGKMMGVVRKKLKWADQKTVRLALDQEVSSLEGLKTPANKRKEKQEGEVEGAPRLIGEATRFHKPGENYLTEGYVVTPKTMELLKQHLKETGGKVVTRFPPEPNGILHIGHATAINFNFSYAEAHGGICYLRYDDTNPEKEEEKFVRGIQEIVEWLGHTPYKITFASDYFPQLYDYAMELIRRDQAYVCHQPHEEVRGLHPPPSPWKDRPREESLRLFEDMKNGKFKEGEAILRMKLTLEDGKQDPVAYRIKSTPHPRTGDTWCIYPTYDFAHCLCDSIENITHSLCTKEFQIKRPSYYWLCNALGIYCPVQWEYSRLNVYHTLVSKRKIQKLISHGIVSDWDDPRLFTLTALRRRGFPPEAINNFCKEYGVMVSDGAIYPELLEAFVRDELNKTATRVMAVLDPLKVIITNFPHNEVVDVKVPNVPWDPSKGTHSVPLERVIYIEQSDFRETPEDGYRRLTPNQPVGLKHASYVLSVQEVVKDPTGRTTELHVSYQKLSECLRRPSAFIHWVSDPLTCTVRLYNRLFLHKDPEDPTEVPGGFLSDVNPNSLCVVENALVDRTVAAAAPLSKYQFERLGYFCLDADSSNEQMVFNWTVNLKEDSTNPVPVFSVRR